MSADDTQLNHSESPENYSDMVCSLKIVSKISDKGWEKTDSH